MTLLSSRLGLTHRCTIERAASGGSDEWGQPVPPVWETHLSGVLCKAWTNAAREPVDADKSVVIEDRRVALPLDTDVTEADRLGDITDAAGTVLFEGPMDIVGVLRYSRHMELLLERVR